MRLRDLFGDDATIEPRFDLPPSDRLILAASKTTQ